LRYCGDIDPEPSSFWTAAARSFWLIPFFFLAAMMACPRVVVGVVIALASGEILACGT
jgi:hypothetical protein